MNTDWTGQELYHYTDYYELKGVIEDREIWMSNVRSMNDKNEMTHFMEALRSVLKTEVDGKDSEIDDLFERQKKRLAGEQAYSFSLSYLRDDAAQWERYAKGGTGVCIKFDAGALSEFIKDRAVLQKVFYQDDMSKHQIKADMVVYLLEGHVFNGFSSIDGVFENAWACSAAYKHTSFKQEEEVRMCLWPFFAKHYNIEAHYRIENWGIREYFPLSLSDDGEKIHHGIIKEIMIGPKTLIPEGVMERYLKSKGLDDIAVAYSNCPLR